jgi:hypothetical protein
VAVEPTIGFEHAWRKLMAALGKTHPALVRRNRFLLLALHQRMKGR